MQTFSNKSVDYQKGFQAGWKAHARREREIEEAFSTTETIAFIIFSLFAFTAIPVILLAIIKWIIIVYNFFF